MQEILKDFAVFSLLLLSLLLSFSFGASTARPFITTTHFSLGILRYLFDVNGAISILPDGDFVFPEKRSEKRSERESGNESQV